MLDSLTNGAAPDADGVATTVTPLTADGDGTLLHPSMRESAMRRACT